MRNDALTCGIDIILMFLIQMLLDFQSLVSFHTTMMTKEKFYCDVSFLDAKIDRRTTRIVFMQEIECNNDFYF